MKQVLHYGEHLRPRLLKLIATQAEQSDSPIPWEADFLERLSHFAVAGKLLRGGLLCFAYEMYSGHKADVQVQKAALALELTHSALLIHDDIMDNDPVRRGQPSLHWQYRQLGLERKLNDHDRFGANMAICGGDAASFMAFGLLADMRIAPKAARVTHRLFVEHLAQVCFGQMQDIYFDAQPAMPAKSAIYELMKAKTASYSLALPLAMGAALAGHPTTVIRKLEAIGETAGIIYQIRDDELGIFGNEDITGKPTGSDIREGKKTLLYYYLMEACEPAERTKLRRIFGNPALSAADIASVQQLMRDKQVARQLDREVEELGQRAAAAVATLRVSTASRTELYSVIDFCTRRQH
jgi:geranylgeranyl diphosphate synthase type I